jgi:hypothetical protein
MLLHGSCGAWKGAGVLFLGDSGSGKSDLLLRLLQRGWQLVADDQVLLAVGAEGISAAAPAALEGMLEVRGLGLFEELPHAPAALRLVVELRARDAVPRLPQPRAFAALGRSLPVVALHAFDASTPDKLLLALGALDRSMALQVGAFAA